MPKGIVVGLVAVAVAFCETAPAGDWLMYRADAAQSGFTAERLPEDLRLAWAHEPAHPPRPAWPSSRRIELDRTFQPIVIDGDVIYAEGGAWKVKTGEEVPFEFHRSDGCGQISACTNLMLFRSATLGYLDLTRTAGVENFGGIRPGCWFNAIPAGGIVLMPDGFAKCVCSYQTRGWIALAPPDESARTISSNSEEQ